MTSAKVKSRYGLKVDTHRQQVLHATSYTLHQKEVEK